MSWDIAPAVDPTIAIPDGGGGVLFHATGTGTQDYVCQASLTDAGESYAWTLVSPDAILSDCKAVVGRHYASEAGPAFPEWQTTDGTYVFAQRRSTFTPDGGAGSIPWLLLNAVDGGGDGVLSRTRFIEGLNTRGGVAPDATTCDATSAGMTARVAYSADYYFFGM